MSITTVFFPFQCADERTREMLVDWYAESAENGVGPHTGTAVSGDGGPESTVPGSTEGA